MEDRFRFRMYDKENKIMLYEDSNELSTEGLYQYEELWWATTAVPISAISYFFDYNSKERFVLQQCTGLRDKNGKLIYEGDLLRYPAKSQYEERCYTFFEVFWHDNDCCDNHIGWQMNRLHSMGGLTDCSRNHKVIPRITEQMEIIGNIYENKELLEEQK